MKLEKLDLPEDVLAPLKRCGFNTAEQVEKCKYLLAIPGFGPKRFDILFAHLEYYYWDKPCP